MIRGKQVEVKCGRCRKPFMARVADRKRGWGKFCSKTCKAVKQEQRTGQYADRLHRPDKTEHRLHPFVDNATYLEHQREFGGMPQFDRNGNFDGIQMSIEDLSYGGYGDAGPDDPMHDGKL